MTDKITIESIVARWSDPASRPLFKGQLIDGDGDSVCRCAQGDVLHVAGYNDDWLRGVGQIEADRKTAEVLGISLGHSILLRLVNDRSPGSPQDVLTNPEKIIGPNSGRVLAFYRHIDAMSDEDVLKTAWAARAARAAREAREAWAARAARAAREAWAARAARAAREAREAWAARAAREAWAAAEFAAYEIVGEIKDPFFLPMFGITTLDQLDD